jgi:hypothetical protein
MTEEKKEKTSGRVQVIDSKIVWTYQDQTISEINLDDVVVIGEYTNSDGPWFDDWFLVFVTRDGHWKHIPWYAENIIELTKVLQMRFEPNFEGSYLTGSTTWDSVIRHPKHLINQPLFTLTPTETYKKPTNFFQKIQYAIGVGGYDTSEYINLTDAVKQELANASR